MTTPAAIDVDTAIRLARHTAVMPEAMHHETEQVLAAEVVRQRKIIAQYRTEVASANRDRDALGLPPVAFPDGWPTCAGVKAS